MDEEIALGIRYDGGWCTLPPHVRMCHAIMRCAHSAPRGDAVQKHPAHDKRSGLPGEMTPRPTQFSLENGHLLAPGTGGMLKHCPLNPPPRRKCSTPPCPPIASPGGGGQRTFLKDIAWRDRLGGLTPPWRNGPFDLKILCLHFGYIRGGKHRHRLTERNWLPNDQQCGSQRKLQRGSIEIPVALGFVKEIAELRKRRERRDVS